MEGNERSLEGSVGDEWFGGYAGLRISGVWRVV